MTTIDQTQKACPVPGIKDTIPPKTPTITFAGAFEFAPDDARIEPQPPPPPPTQAPRGDPTYIQLSNMEGGTKAQIMAVSGDNAGAKWADQKTVADCKCSHSFEIILPTGRDLANRTAGFYLPKAEMERVGLKPGHMFELRLVDEAGNCSIPTPPAELQGTEWANQNIQAPNADGTFETIGRGARLTALCGENGETTNFLAVAVADTDPPVILRGKEHLTLNTVEFTEQDVEVGALLTKNWALLIVGAEDQKTLTADSIRSALKEGNLPHKDHHAIECLIDDPKQMAKFESAHDAGIGRAPGINQQDLAAIQAGGKRVVLDFDHGLEPGATVQIQNQNTGKNQNLRIPPNRMAQLVLPDMENGTKLMLTPTDNNGVVGKTEVLWYSEELDGGYAEECANPLAARLGGATIPDQND